MPTTMPITKGEAYKIARERLKGWEREVGEELLLLEEHTLERDFGWVFFYNGCFSIIQSVTSKPRSPSTLWQAMRRSS
jgi:hypothetical protein